MKNTLVLVISLVGLTSVWAQENKTNQTYADAGYTSLTYTGKGTEFLPGAVRLVVGANANDFAGYEALVGVGVVSGYKEIDGTSNKISIPTLYGIYGKAYANPSKDVEIFGRLGWSGFIRESVPASSTSNSSNGLSYGVGAKISVNKSTSIFADYMSYYPKQNGIGLSGFTIGGGFSF